MPEFSAGSHIDVHLKNGLVRQYSLCNDPAESHRYQIAVLRDPNSRGGSVAVHDSIDEGDVITISEPRNHFPPTSATHYLLFAGGIGVTPILCMAERLAQIGADFRAVQPRLLSVIHLSCSTKPAPRHSRAGGNP